MISFERYVRANTLEEAYALNQERSSRIAGGMMWLRLGRGRVKTLIDISGLGLDQIEDTGRTIRIGAMCTLRQVEQSELIRELCGPGLTRSIQNIVGVQFRNQATVGGSIFGRYGFSDILTAFLALDTFVELYNGGTMRLSEFVRRKPDKDLLISIIIRKSKRYFHYDSVRLTKTDLPILTCAVVMGTVKGQESWYVSVGARPMRAELLEISRELTGASDETLARFAAEAADAYVFKGNMRASAEYRRRLAEAVILKAVKEILAKQREV